MDSKKKFYILLAVILLVLLADQWVKFWVKTNMSIGDEIYMFGKEWAVIHFVENNGMAFGLTFGGEYGKLALSLFRIAAVVLLGFYLRWLLKERAPVILLAGFGLILAGALGNIIDSAFYGLLFSESTFHSDPAIFLPPEGGYASFLHGKVVDMLYFPVAEGYFPDWFPVWSGEPYLFFRPVFNIADMAITSGVIMILVLHVFFSKRIHLGGAVEAAPAEEMITAVPEMAYTVDSTASDYPAPPADMEQTEQGEQTEDSNPPSA
jgi:signal peptidase II